MALANDAGSPGPGMPHAFGGTRKETIAVILFSVFGKLYTKLYKTCYYVGIQFMRTIKRYRRDVLYYLSNSKLATFFHSRVLQKRLGEHMLELVEELFDPFINVARKFRNARLRIAQKSKKSLWLALGECAGFVRRGIGHVLHLLVAISHYVFPVLGVVFLVMTVQHFSGLTFGLEVEYGGKTLGYIRSEAEFNQAEKMMQGRIVTDTSADPIYTIPTYKVTVVDEAEFSTIGEICDEIIKASNSVIVEASGLYIDGQFYGATYEGALLSNTLEGLINVNRTGDPTEKVNFVQKVELIPGLYPQTSVVESSSIESLITTEVEGQQTYVVESGDSPWSIAQAVGVRLSDLMLMNPGIDKSLLPGKEIVVSQARPFLPIKVSKTVVYEEEQPYEIVQNKNKNYNRGYTMVTKEGENGIREVTAQVTLINGVQSEKKILSTRTLKDPVNQEVTVGTKEIVFSGGGSSSGGSTTGSGQFMWPVLGGGKVTCLFGAAGYVGHTGVDIGLAYGAKIVASDSGVVVLAKTNAGGYGNHVMIDHGNGVQTLYAHMSKRYVSRGESVKKGETIGLMGRTGNVTGTHLHFEIRINGRYVNPLKYLY